MLQLQSSIEPFSFKCTMADRRKVQTNEKQKSHKLIELVCFNGNVRHGRVFTSQKQFVSPPFGFFSE